MDLYERLHHLKVLLVDDDRWIRDALRLLMESEGCSLLALETAEEGIKALKEQPYDIVLADYRLPGIDGLHFLRRICRVRPQAKKVLISGYLAEEVVTQALAAGVQGFITKPLTARGLEESLLMLLDEEGGATEVAV